MSKAILPTLLVVLTMFEPGCRAEPSATNSFEPIALEWEGFARSGSLWVLRIKEDGTGSIGTTDVRMPLRAWRLKNMAFDGKKLKGEAEPIHEDTANKIIGEYEKLWESRELTLRFVDGQGKEMFQIRFRPVVDLAETRGRVRKALDDGQKSGSNP